MNYVYVSIKGDPKHLHRFPMNSSGAACSCVDHIDRSIIHQMHKYHHQQIHQRHPTAAQSRDSKTQAQDEEYEHVMGARC